MITKLTDQDKIDQYDHLFRAAIKNAETIKEQSALITQLSDELAAMTKALDNAGDVLEIAVNSQKETREAYEAETLSTIDMTKKIMELEGCLRTEAMRIENLKADRDEWKRKAMDEQRLWAAASSALRGLLEAEEATVDDFNAKEIDGLEAAMREARRVLGISGHNA